MAEDGKVSHPIFTAGQMVRTIYGETRTVRAVPMAAWSGSKRNPAGGTRAN
jgi:hypothetical protein